MSGIACVRGDATVPSVKGVKVIAHVRNDIGGRGKGFVLAVSRRRPEPEAAYRAWRRDRAADDFGLGAVRLVQAERYVRVADMIGRRGVRTGSKGVPVRYEATDTALDRLAGHTRALGASVHMPRIGCGPAGGTWSRIEPLITERPAKRGTPVTVYDHGDRADRSPAPGARSAAEAPMARQPPSSALELTPVPSRACRNARASRSGDRSLRRRPPPP